MGGVSVVRASSLSASIAARLLRSRWLMRAPIWIYRARGGAVFGSRILLLEHIGRKSGAPRYAALEVVDHPSPDVYVVASGFGRKAQWFRNIRANPRVRVYAGSHPSRAATARVLDQAEADRALAAYRTRHPRAWQRMRPVLEERLGVPITDTGTPLPSARDGALTPLGPAHRHRGEQRHKQRGRKTVDDLVAHPHVRADREHEVQRQHRRRQPGQPGKAGDRQQTDRRGRLHDRQHRPDVVRNTQVVKGFADRGDLDAARDRVDGVEHAQRRVGLR
ncbi:hypothetical protein MLM_1785A [Mycobacterium lepraemurium]|nr:hypothetical protein MLM_1785A [Mycobacterium lepraemurium]